jgi:hypothetical protein
MRARVGTISGFYGFSGWFPNPTRKQWKHCVHGEGGLGFNSNARRFFVLWHMYLNCGEEAPIPSR